MHIIPYCNKIEKLTSICGYCSQKIAQLTIRLTSEKRRVVVGNEDIYKPICNYCLANKKNLISNSLQE